MSREGQATDRSPRTGATGAAEEPRSVQDINIFYRNDPGFLPTRESPEFREDLGARRFGLIARPSAFAPDPTS